ncbi:hypothetical protein, partial [Microbacterium aurum]
MTPARHGHCAARRAILDSVDGRVHPPPKHQPRLPQCQFLQCRFGISEWNALLLDPPEFDVA